MRALVKVSSGAGNMHLVTDVPVPVPGPGEVRVRIAWCGICGTDLHILDGSFKADTPVIPGHEFSGWVDALGEGVTGWAPGDRVVAEQHSRHCGQCRYCLSGRRHLCQLKRSPGYRINGAFADYITIEASLLHRVPEGVSMTQAALVEPMAVAAHGIFHTGELGRGDSVVILGCGPLALMATQMLKSAGATQVIVTGLQQDANSRFALALRLGADICVNVQKENPVQVVLSRTGGFGADGVVDLTGSPAAIEQGFSLLARGGTFCAMGIPSQTVTLSWADRIMHAGRIVFCFSSDYPCWEYCLSLLEKGRFNTEPFISAAYNLENWVEAFEQATSGRSLKVLFKLTDQEKVQ